MVRYLTMIGQPVRPEVSKDEREGDLGVLCGERLTELLKGSEAMRTIRYYIDMRAKEQPDDVFMIAPEPGLSLTYAQLREDSIEFGKQLLKKGLNKGDKISYMLSNGYQTTKIFLGAMYSGFVIAPLNLLAQPSQLEYVLEHSDTRLVFFTEDQREGSKRLVGRSPGK